jgi:preprotein translocase subunit SecA
MLNFITKKVAKLFGSKSDRDIKEILPILKSTLAEYAKLNSLSNDELRGKTIEFKKRIADYSTDEYKKVESLKKEIQKDTSFDVNKKEAIYKEIDELEKLILKKEKEITDTILPEAFAVVKETARRFSENTKIEVSATDYDKELAEDRESIEIVGDKAFK